MITPPALRPGDRIRIVAGSGPVPEDRFNAGLTLLQKRYEVVFDRSQVFAKQGFLAGDDSSRAAALNDAFEEPGTQAIWMARGGYGLTRILPLLSASTLRANPKVIVGFSDATALLALCAQAGVVSYHGPVVTQLAELPPGDREHLWQVLEGAGPALLTDLETITPGVAAGRLLGGNLEVFSRLIGTPFLPDLDDALLFFEDVGERPYRIDRLLTHLQQAGVFSRARGLVLGEFFHCQESASVDSPGVQEVLRERLGGLNVPVAQGGLFGHGRSNRVLPYGAQVVLDVGQGVLRIQ